MKLETLTKLVINLPERTDRLKVFKNELKYIGSPEFTIIEGVKNKHSHRGIGQAHLNCIQYAKENKLPYILVMEDDVRFQGKEKTLNYINECLENLPSEWDVLLGGVYLAKNKKPYNDYWHSVGEFCGLQFYIVNANAYDKFLSYDFSIHIDRWVNKGGLKSFVSSKFFATQYTGISDNTGRRVDYEYRLKEFDIL